MANLILDLSAIGNPQGWWINAGASGLSTLSVGDCPHFPTLAPIRFNLYDGIPSESWDSGNERVALQAGQVAEQEWCLEWSQRYVSNTVPYPRSWDWHLLGIEIHANAGGTQSPLNCTQFPNYTDGAEYFRRTPDGANHNFTFMESYATTQFGVWEHRRLHMGWYPGQSIGWLHYYRGGTRVLQIDNYDVSNYPSGHYWKCQSYRPAWVTGDFVADYCGMLLWDELVPERTGGGTGPSPPGDVTGFTATPGDSQIGLVWTNPAQPYDRIIIRERSDGVYPTWAGDGVEAYNGSGQNVVRTGLTNGLDYRYSAWAEIIANDPPNDFSPNVAHAGAIPVAAPSSTRHVDNWRYELGAQSFLTGGIDLVNDDIRWALVDESYTPNVGHQYLSDIPGGQFLGSTPSITGRSITDGIFNGAVATVGQTNNGTLKGMVLYKWTGQNSTSPLLVFIKRDSDLTEISEITNGVSVNVTFPSDGIPISSIWPEA